MIHKIVATIAPENILEETIQNAIITHAEAIDIIELRVDQWTTVEKENVQANIERLRALPATFEILVTYRSSSQGGVGNTSTAHYWQHIESLVAMSEVHIDMLDIEWHKDVSHTYYETLFTQAKERGIQVILSYHDFEQTPAIDELKHMYYKMHALRPDYMKIAVMPNKKQDVVTLLDALTATAEVAPGQAIGISMSHMGTVSRIAQCAFGGVMTYGTLGEAHAPGQLHVSDLFAQRKYFK